MPKIIRTAVFSKDETRVLARAAQFVDIVFPLASDPLVQRSPETLARAVQDDDQRRRAMRPLLNVFDPISYPHLRAAQSFLDVLHTQIVRESDVEHWLGLSDTPDAEQSRQMAEVLAAERGGQQRLIRDAIEIVAEALAWMGPADDPRAEDRRSHYGGFGNPTAVDVE